MERAHMESQECKVTLDVEMNEPKGDERILWNLQSTRDKAIELCDMLFANGDFWQFRIGIASAVSWRMYECSSREADGFLPHCDAFQRMYIIWYSSGKEAGALEEELISRWGHSDKLVNINPGGEQASETYMFAYVCCNNLDEVNKFGRQQRLAHIAKFGKPKRPKLNPHRKCVPIKIAR